jgi:hypothetical protein
MELGADINIENAGPLAVGPAHVSEAQKGDGSHSSLVACQNCGAQLVGDFCHACGQHGHVHRTVLHVIEEVFHGITHFDSRTWRSLPMLAFRPGTLTRNYVMGQRVRYVPPFAMFLFSIFAMFLAFAFSGGPGFVTDSAATHSVSLQEAQSLVTERENDLKEVRAEIVSAQKELADLNASPSSDPGEFGAATGALAGAQGQEVVAVRKLDEAKAALATAASKPKAVSKISGSVSFNDKQTPKQALKEIRAEKVKALKDGDGVAAGLLTAAERAAEANAVGQPKAGELEISGNFMTVLKDSMRKGELNVNTPWPKLDEKIKHKFENPDLLFYKLQNTAYKFSFLLVPLSLPFIWLMLFWKRGTTLYDHAVFTLYSLSFVSFLFLAISLAAHWMPAGQLIGWAALVMPVHIFFQFKGAYALKWFSALWRTLLFCLVFSWIVVGLFLMAIIALGVTG